MADMKRLSMSDAMILLNLVGRGIADDFGMELGAQFGAQINGIVCADDGDIVVAFHSDWSEPKELELDKRIQLAQREMAVFPNADGPTMMLMQMLWRAWGDAKRTFKPNRISGQTILDLTDTEQLIFGRVHALRVEKVRGLIAKLIEQGLLYNLNEMNVPENAGALYNIYAVNGQLIFDLLNRPMSERRTVVPTRDYFENMKRQAGNPKFGVCTNTSLALSAIAVK